MTMKTELIEALEYILEKRTSPVPIDIALWSGDDVALYLRRDKRTVMEKLACLPDFPKAIKLPSASGGKGWPLWVAKEVVSWARGYQEA